MRRISTIQAKHRLGLIAITRLLMLCYSLLLFGCNPSSSGHPEPTDAQPVFSVPVKAGTQHIRSPLLLSINAGQTWQDVGQGLPGDLQVSFLEQKGQEIVLASDNQGVFLSSNNRTQWRPIGTNLPGQKINALFIAGDTIYVGVYQHGVFKSSDEGTTWQSLNYNLPELKVQSFWKLANKCLVGTDAGIFTLAKGEKIWQPTDITNQVVSIFGQDGLLIAGTSQGTIISKDEGTSWEWIHRAGAVHYTHPLEDYIYEFVINGDLVRSADLGKNWVSTNYYPRAGSYVYEIEAVGDYWLMSNNYGIHRSSDKGTSWELIYPTEEMAFLDFLVIGNTVYGGTRIWDEYRKRDKR